MTIVFVAGSRKISKLNSDVRARIDCIIAKNFKILVGDANGVDKAVQTHLHEKSYDLVEVFCSGDACRNNIGDWKIHSVDANGKKDFDFYAAKDQVMAEKASYGFMIWDGESTGTLMNVQRLIEKDKKVVVYVSPSQSFVDLKSKSDWDRFIEDTPNNLKQRIRKVSSSEAYSKKIPMQILLL